MACNDDAYDMVNGRKLPGAGVIVDSILESLNNDEGGQRTERPEVVGKPNPYSCDLIMSEHNISIEKKSRMIMFGDRMDTDILFGTLAGIDTCLVRTGVTDSE